MPMMMIMTFLLTLMNYNVYPFRIFHCELHKPGLIVSTSSIMGKNSNVETYYCDKCGTEHIKWVGRCTSCKEWNSIKLIKYTKCINSLLNLDRRTIQGSSGGKDTIIDATAGSPSWMVEKTSLIQMSDVNLDESFERSLFNSFFVVKTVKIVSMQMATLQLRNESSPWRRICPRQRCSDRGRARDREEHPATAIGSVHQ